MVHGHTLEDCVHSLCMSTVCRQGNISCSRPPQGECVGVVVMMQSCPMQGAGQWFELQDLHVQDLLPQMITLAEAYIQVCLLACWLAAVWDKKCIHLLQIWELRTDENA